MTLLSSKWRAGLQGRGERDCWGAPLEPDYEPVQEDRVRMERCQTCRRVLANPRAGSHCEGFYCNKEELT